jgi:hypothetical protein
MHFHPEKERKVATWHIVHAVSGGKDAKGVLETDSEHKYMGGHEGGG